MDAITAWIEHIVLTWVGGLEQSGYWGIFLLMAVESSLVPFPSEIVMIPAGALAAQGRLSVWGAIMAGTAGSLVGALINYYLARLLGRAFLLRYGKYIFLPPAKMLWAEEKWEKYGEMTTFVCRLLPAIRQLISLPAGLARMNLSRFCFWTTLGAGIWVTLLTYTGYLLGDTAQTLWAERKLELTWALVGGATLIMSLWVALQWVRARRRAASSKLPAES